MYLSQGRIFIQIKHLRQKQTFPTKHFVKGFKAHVLSVDFASVLGY